MNLNQGNNSTALSNIDILECVKNLNLSKFRGVYMRDTLPNKPRINECGIMNLNTSHQDGSHWTAWYKNGMTRIYFDSFGQITPIELQKYLKTSEEFETDKNVIQRNTDIVQPIGTSICGHLCLFVLNALSKGCSFQQVLNQLNGYSQDNRIIT